MNDTTLAPTNILKAGLQTLHRANTHLRNANLPNSGIDQDSILKLAEAIHNIPRLLLDWKEDSLKEIRLEFGTFKQDSWPNGSGLDLLAIFDSQLK